MATRPIFLLALLQNIYKYGLIYLRAHLGLVLFGQLGKLIQKQGISSQKPVSVCNILDFSTLILAEASAGQQMDWHSNIKWRSIDKNHLILSGQKCLQWIHLNEHNFRCNFCCVQRHKNCDLKTWKSLYFLGKKTVTHYNRCCYIHTQLLWVPEAAEIRKRNCEIEINPCQIGKTSAKHLHSMNTNWHTRAMRQC